MDALGTVLSASQTLLTALQCSQLKEILSTFGYKSQLEDLQLTVSTINTVFRDAETKQELSHEAQLRMQQLKDAVFEADDLFDEFVTLTEQKQLVEAGGSLSKKASRFFSRTHNPLSLAYRMSQGVKDIKKKLDKIAYNSQQFGFKIDSEPIKKRRPETCSYVNQVEMIGRQHDLDHIVGTYLTSNDQRQLSFLTIVGIGGLGKTALAQLVYNDPRVTTAFPLRLWTCVADQDQQAFNVKDILVKILASATGENPDHGSTMDQVQSQAQQQLVGKKFLLVLDDVWTESRDQWCDVARYLIRGAKGSWIVVTSRSQETAKIIGDGLTYNLEGLSKKDSWLLFERTAFTSDQLSNPSDELVEIGRKIVDRCAGVPLAIRVAGSLLYGQDKSKWQSVQKIGLANIRQSGNGIIPILKLSFHNLETPLKSCFSYCALFPKDHVMKKEDLISLWMAQGYIVPFDKGQSLLEAAEEYFLILLKRCFFQDIEKDDFGEIESCKMHDLMHDVAQSVSEKEIICSTNIIMSNKTDDLIKKARHLLIAGSWKYDKYSSDKTYVRSLLFINRYSNTENVQFRVESLVVNYRCLRALDLSVLGLKSLPYFLGELLHLRYLDLSGNEYIELLPKSITKLYNLQTLKLYGCMSLKELPKDLSKLVKLRVLNITYCHTLRYMPRGIGKLSGLERLSDFVVGGDEDCSRSSYLKQVADGLEDLKALDNLKGKLRISITWLRDGENVVNEEDNRVMQALHREGLYLMNKEYLSAIHLSFIEKRDGISGATAPPDDVVGGAMVSLMEDLQPHSNLKELEVWDYEGVRIPWINHYHLPNLVHLKLTKCQNLEYIGSSSEAPLQLRCLSKLNIWCCPALASTMMCPRLEDLHFGAFNEGMRIIVASSSFSSCSSNPQHSGSNSSCRPYSCSDILVPKLKKIKIDNVAWLESLSMESLQCLQTLEIIRCYDEAMPKWISELTSLRELEMSRCSRSLTRRCQEHPPGEDWPYIKHIPNIRIY